MLRFLVGCLGVVLFFYPVSPLDNGGSGGDTGGSGADTCTAPLDEMQVCQDEHVGKAGDGDEKDPMLQPMPIDVPPYYFNAYTRAGISSFYREPPGSRKEAPPDFSLGQAGKFINLSPRPMELYV